MRSLVRDKQEVYVSFFEEKVACEDVEGRLTGKHVIKRSDPVCIECTVSSARGNADNSPFGIDLDYDRTVIVEDIAFPITESAVLWIDNAIDTSHL